MSLFYILRQGMWESEWELHMTPALGQFFSGAHTILLLPETLKGLDQRTEYALAHGMCLWYAA